ncbi:MAG: Nitrilase/cyanide hydratase and apolipoprotein N-acyltransferase [Planctomycetaceae bacterium]|nr:Nitrilase/cyanide hydratase and apolipoprotein N-acyltransferase [Planctomycetaceae bacterium]
MPNKIPAPFTVALVQAGSILFDTPRTLEKLSELSAAAKLAGAKLAVFPEAFIGGYPKGEQFGTTLGRRTPEGRDYFRAYFDSAIEVPSLETEVIGNAARDNELFLVVGVIERSGGTLYCTALFFGPDGHLLGKHRKLLPTALERVIWGQGDGSTLTVLDTPLGKLGAVICWENYMPLLRTAMYAKGIQLYCAPTVDDRDSWISSMRHIACEGRCFILSACQYLPAAHPNEPPLIRGGTCLVSPFGDLLIAPRYGSEEVLTAEIDLNEITRGKFDLDVVGHYARPEIFQLHVNEAPLNTVH